METYPGDAERKASIESLRALEAEITELAGHLNAGNHRFLKLVAEFDNRNGWSNWEAQSCAHWLNWKCGIALGAAREKVRVAHALEKLPEVSAAMEKGQLSYSKVRALTRIAIPETEKDLLAIALHGTASHMEKLVRGYRRAEAYELNREAKQQAGRELSYFYDDDGSLVLKGRLPAEIGALFVKALDLATGNMIQAELGARKEREKQPDVSAETPMKARPSFSARRADALGEIAESFLAHGREAMNGGDKHQIVIHVSAETLAAQSEVNKRNPMDKNSPSHADHCRLEHGPSIAAETARRLACDASLVAVLENNQGEPLNVGRKTRSISPALKRSLNARDKGCRFPGCCNTQYVDAHHIQHWIHGGETKASNLITLCRFHHRKVHEGGMTIQVLDDGAFKFVKPDGRSFTSTAVGCAQPMSDWTQLPDSHHRSGIHIDPNTAITRWTGENMDYGMAVEGLFRLAEQAKSVSAETSG